MFKKLGTFILIGLLLNLGFLQTSVLANSKEDKQTAKIKTAIFKLGTGKNARVVLKLQNKTELRGYISEISDESFTIVNESNNSSSKIPYPEVKQLKGNNLSTGAKVAIVFGIFAALIAAAVFFGSGGP
jgi:hypothetical protein